MESESATDGSASSAVGTGYPGKESDSPSVELDDTASARSWGGAALEPLPPKRLCRSSAKATTTQAGTLIASDNSGPSSKTSSSSNRGPASERQKGDIRWQKNTDLPESQSNMIEWKPVSKTYTNIAPTPTELFEMFFDDSL